MHDSAKLNCSQFFDTYKKYIGNHSVKVVDIGSQDFNGSLREVAPKEFDYLGLDFVNGKNVDIVLTDPYVLPLETGTVDVVLSSSCFEHSQMFWLSFLEIMRILKPQGLFYLNAPSAGPVHNFPFDCWRFYPDSGLAMVEWSKKNGFNSVLLESYIQGGGEWSDFVAVFLKDSAFVEHYPTRILDKKLDFENGQLYGQKEKINPIQSRYNERKLQLLGQIIYGKVDIDSLK